ncbi:unnamed protein product, partial [Iphiclides podalirius]
MRDLYRARGPARGGAGRSEAVAAPIDSWGYSSSGHCRSSCAPRGRFHRSTLHSLGARTRGVDTNKLPFFPPHSHSPRRAPE